MFARFALKGILGLFVAVALLAGAGQPAFATTLIVNSTDDGGDASAGDGVCETAAGNGLCTLRGAIDALGEVRFSPDGKYLATTSRDGNIRLYDTTSWRLLRTLIGHTAPAYAVDWKPNKFCKWPSWKIQTSAPKTAESESILSTMALSGINSEPVIKKSSTETAANIASSA